MYSNCVAHTSGKYFSTMSFYQMFLMISYFTFVYHILIHHFFYLPGFIKKAILFSKETVIFLYRIKFSGNKEIDLGYSRTCSVPVDGGQYYKHMENEDELHLCCPSCVPCGCDRAAYARKPGQIGLTWHFKKEKSCIEFYSQEITLFLSDALKEPKFQLLECIRVSPSLYTRMKVWTDHLMTVLLISH